MCHTSKKISKIFKDTKAVNNVFSVTHQWHSVLHISAATSSISPVKLQIPQCHKVPHPAIQHNWEIRVSDFGPQNSGTHCTLKELENCRSYLMASHWSPDGRLVGSLSPLVFPNKPQQTAWSLAQLWKKKKKRGMCRELKRGWFEAVENWNDKTGKWHSYRQETGSGANEGSFLRKQK